MDELLLGVIGKWKHVVLSYVKYKGLDTWLHWHYCVDCTEDTGVALYMDCPGCMVLVSGYL